MNTRTKSSARGLLPRDDVITGRLGDAHMQAPLSRADGCGGSHVDSAAHPRNRIGYLACAYVRVPAQAP